MILLWINYSITAFTELHQWNDFKKNGIVSALKIPKLALNSDEVQVLTCVWRIHKSPAGVCDLSALTQWPQTPTSELMVSSKFNSTTSLQAMDGVLLSLSLCVDTLYMYYKHTLCIVLFLSFLGNFYLHIVQCLWFLKTSFL